MRDYKFLTGLALLMPLIFLPTGQATAQTQYLGEVCWQVSDESTPQPDDDIVKLGVQQVGDNHLIFNGLVLPGAEDTDPPQILFGSGEIVGEEALIAITGTIRNTEAIAKVQYYLRIALDTLAGSLEAIGTFYDRAGDQIASDIGNSFLTPTDCPA